MCVIYLKLDSFKILVKKIFFLSLILWEIFHFKLNPSLKKSLALLLTLAFLNIMTPYQNSSCHSSFAVQQNYPSDAHKIPPNENYIHLQLQYGNMLTNIFNNFICFIQEICNQYN